MSRTNRNLPYQVAFEKVVGLPAREAVRLDVGVPELLEQARNNTPIAAGELL